MSSPSRTAQFTRLQKILKKHYQPAAPDPSRSVLEHLLFGCLLENAQYAAAEQAFAALEHTFFDWNEIRVSSVRELSEVVAGLPEPSAAAHHVKRSLQSIFEATYSFDLEDLRKLNLGPAVERLEKIEGTTPFAVAYVVQVALGGHSIPIDSGALSVLLLAGAISEADAAAWVVPGLERAIPKNAGVEFGSLLHQLGADFVASPYAPSLHNILLEINPQIKDRLPRRRDAKSFVLVPRAGAEKVKKARPAAEGQEPPKAKAEAKSKEEAPGPPKKKPTPGKKKPGAAVLPMVPGAPAAAAHQEAAAGEEPDQQPDVAATKKKTAPTKKKLSPKKPAEPTREAAPTDPGPEASDAHGLAKRKPR